MKAFWIVNPNSAAGRAKKKWPELSRRALRFVPPFAHAFTEGPSHATQLARGALRDGYSCIVAVGGDGTVNEVVNGFFDAGQPVSPGAVFGVVPFGTGGDLRRTLGLGRSLDEALARLAGGATKPFDVGAVEFAAPSGEARTRHFVNICSFGVSGEVAKSVNASSKRLGGKLTFMWGSLKALTRYKDKPVRLSFDGKPFESSFITSVAVANGQYFGGGMKVAPLADTSDGMFDVTIWSGYGLSDFILKSRGVYSGAHARWSGTRMLRCRSVAAESDDEVLIDCDGEQVGKLPCSMKILPHALKLLG